MGGAPGGPLPEKKEEPPIPLPWYVSSQNASPPIEQERLEITSKLKVEINTASWLRRLMRVCEKISQPIIDPEIMEHTPLGTLVMRWQRGPKILEILFLEQDIIGTVSLMAENSEEYLADISGWSQGSVKTEDEIEKVWRWLNSPNETDNSYLSELLAITLSRGQEIKVE
jgi:hypothetical protein